MSKQGHEWNCTICTYINKSSALQCSMCETKRSTPGATSGYKEQNKLEVKQFLISIDFEFSEKYYDTFIDNGYDKMQHVMEIEMEDLQTMNILLAHRRRIINSIKKLQSKANSLKQEIIKQEEDDEIEILESLPTNSNSNISSVSLITL